MAKKSEILCDYIGTKCNKIQCRLAPYIVNLHNMDSFLVITGLR